MTIKEAENQYYCDVENCREQLVRYAKKAILIWNIIGAVLIGIGFILAIIGFATPPEKTSWGYELSTGALFERAFGMGTMFLGTFFIILMNLFWRKAIKRGPVSFLPQIRTLYLNYLKCDDMNKDDKEFYKQELEEIRNMQLVNAIHGASIAASTAIMFSALPKQ